MAHVGGGSYGGGFHSGSSGSTTSIPKTDVYGNNHSTYYYRPGFYYNGIYVPYSRVHRKFHAISRFIVFYIIAIVFIVSGILSVNFRKSDEKLTSFSLDRYSDVYDGYQYKESNILIEIVAYDNLKEIDYLPIVGDNVISNIDEKFGNEHSLFGSLFAKNLAKEENKVNNLYQILTTSLSGANESFDTKYFYLNQYKSDVLNNTNFNLGNNLELNNACKEFYNKTGYNITIDINTFDTVYPTSYVGLAILCSIGAAIILLSTTQIFKTLKAVKKINEEDKNGNLEKYYEGEEKYEDHIKKHSIDSPFKYDRQSYDYLRKEYNKKGK